MSLRPVGITTYSKNIVRNWLDHLNNRYSFFLRTLACWASFLAVGADARFPNAAGQSGCPIGLLETNTLVAVYGRSFNVAPILGRLGTYKDMGAMAADTASWVQGISAVNDGKHVVIGIHLIYALAVPCTGKGDCLKYLGSDIVTNYIEPAAQRGWVVILDTQLGRSNPVDQINDMIKHGYLKYDNVHVAIDPEFHASAGQHDPGIPIGTVSATQINAVQKVLDDYVASEKLKTKKILIVHQFGDPTVHDGVPFMIQQKKTVRDFPNVELVIDADGLGSPVVKLHKYNLMTDCKVYPFVFFRGIKIFFPNKWERRHHFDTPPMTVDEIFGATPVPGGLRPATKPNVVIIT